MKKLIAIAVVAFTGLIAWALAGGNNKAIYSEEDENLNEGRRRISKPRYRKLKKDIEGHHNNSTMKNLFIKKNTSHSDHSGNESLVQL